MIMGIRGFDFGEVEYVRECFSKCFGVAMVGVFVIVLAIRDVVDRKGCRRKVLDF